MSQDNDVLQRIAAIQDQLRALIDELGKLETQLPPATPEQRRASFVVIKGGKLRGTVALPVLALARYRPRPRVAVTGAVLGAVVTLVALAPSTAPGRPTIAEPAGPGLVHIHLISTPRTPSSAPQTADSPAPTPTPTPRALPTAAPAPSGSPGAPGASSTPTPTTPAPSTSPTSTPPTTPAPSPTPTCGLIVISVQPLVTICLL